MTRGFRRAAFLSVTILIVFYILKPSIAYAQNGRSFVYSSRGVVTHWATGSDLDSVVYMGFNWVRTGVGWDVIESDFTEPPTYHWEIADKIVKDCVARNLQILWGLPYTPQWASSNGRQNGYPKDDTARRHWRMFVRAVAERYAKQINYFEVWNEPNNARFWQGTAEQYVNYILIPAAEEIKAVNPNNEVVAPTLMNRRGARISVESFFGELGKLGANKYIDIVSQNVYEKNPKNLVDQFIIGDYECWFVFCVKKRVGLFDIYDQNGFSGHKVWINEFGWRSDRVGEDVQAKYIVSTFKLLSKIPRIENAFVYELKDDDRYGARWGMVRGNELPKTSFRSVSDLFRNYLPR